jgi:Ca2+/Na+ antiporter
LLSSAILYVAIVAIWAGVLIPRYLRRDTSDRGVVPDDAVAETETVAEEEPAPPLPRTQVVREARRGSEVDGFSLGPEHARVMSARRRLLMLLVTLAVVSCALAVTQLAAWWVIVPPAVMLVGYVVLLREAAQADAERRELVRAQVAPVSVPVPVPVPAPEAEIIDISASRAQGDQEQLYDQYADAKLRAVGD